MTSRTPRRRRGGPEVTDEFGERLHVALMAAWSLEKNGTGEFTDDDTRAALEKAIADAGGAELLIQPQAHLTLQAVTWLADVLEKSIDEVFGDLYAAASQGVDPTRPTLTLIHGTGPDHTPGGAA